MIGSTERDEENAVYRSLLESTKAIPWRVDWAAQRFTYIGPQIVALLGWERETWIGINDWADRIHPEDRDRVVDFCISQSLIGNDHEAAYRALTASGGYVWIRDVVHVVRNDAGVEALIGFMLEVSKNEPISHVALRVGSADARLSVEATGGTGFSERGANSSVRRLERSDRLIGQLVHGRYRVEKRIGKGGMGVVYLAEHVFLRRKVALKTLNEYAFASDEMVARFEREAMAAAVIGNEHIIAVTDVGQLYDGRCFIVMEYLDGVDLAHAVGAGGTFAMRRALDVTIQLCDALTAIHKAGIVHRDLKPENVFLVAREGTYDFVKVLDFGVCKQLERDSNWARLTQTGIAIGTPQYMAPEQIDHSSEVDARTDVYAVGAILYYLLTGTAPFSDPTLPGLLMRICSEPAPLVRASRSEIPRALEAVIARSLERCPNGRYQSSADLRLALEPFIATH